MVQFSPDDDLALLFSFAKEASAGNVAHKFAAVMEGSASQQ